MRGRVHTIGVVGEHLKDPFVLVGEGYGDLRPAEAHLLSNVVDGRVYMHGSPLVQFRPTDKLVFGRERYTITGAEGDTIGEGGYWVVFGAGKVTGRKELKRGMQGVPIVIL